MAVNIRPQPRKTPLYGKKPEKPTSERENITKNATNWLLFWLVAGISITKDLFEIVWALLQGVGVGLTATIAGSVIGIPIMVMAIGMSWFISLTVFIISMAYFVYTKQRVLLKLVIMSISTIIGMIPVLNVLPEATIGFFTGAFVSTIAAVARKTVGSVTGGAKKIITEN